MLKFALLFVFVSLATHSAQAKDHTHPTKPPHLLLPHANHVKDSYKFTVEGSYMIMNTHDTCYLWKLSDADVALTSDPSTITSIEAKMFTKLGDGSSATAVDKHMTTIDHHVIGHCDHHSIMEFGATGTATGTVTTPIV